MNLLSFTSINIQDMELAAVLRCVPPFVTECANYTTWIARMVYQFTNFRGSYRPLALDKASRTHDPPKVAYINSTVSLQKSSINCIFVA